MSEINVNNENFENVVIKNEMPVLVDFWAPWCGPCMMIADSISEIANEYSGKIKVAKVNVDNNEKIAMLYSISSIPTILLFNNGKVINTSVGYKSKQALIEELELDKI